MGMEGKNTPVMPHRTCVNDLTSYVEGKNGRVDAHSKNENTEVSTVVALVCMVSIDRFEYFYAGEVPFLVEDGYFKVRRR